MSSDVLIVGGGVIGLSIAYELAGRGTKVLVLERGATGQEASWAGAGILPPGNLARATTPEAILRGASSELWHNWQASLVEETGIDIGYRLCGGLEVRLAEESSPSSRSGAHGFFEVLNDEISNWELEGVPVERLSPPLLRSRFPSVTAETIAAYFLPTLAQVRNPWYLSALKQGCLKKGVEIREGCPVVDWRIRDRRLRGALLPSGDIIEAANYCLTSGAWSGALSQQAGISLAIRPIRGQIVLLETQRPVLPCLLQDGRRYIVPRQDGKVLIGATEEDVGFEKRNTAEAVAELIRFGVRHVSELSSAKFVRAWSGLRPGTCDDLPYLGQAPGLENLFLAAGHFRSGLQFSPITAHLLSQMILGEATSVSISPYRCDRAQ